MQILRSCFCLPLIIGWPGEGSAQDAADLRSSLEVMAVALRYVQTEVAPEARIVLHSDLTGQEKAPPKRLNRNLAREFANLVDVPLADPAEVFTCAEPASLEPCSLRGADAVATVSAPVVHGDSATVDVGWMKEVSTTSRTTYVSLEIWHLSLRRTDMGWRVEGVVMKEVT